LDKGREVVAVDKNTQILSELKDNPNLKVIDGDIWDSSLMSKALESAEWVFHLASAHLSITLTDQDYHNINVDASRNLVELSHKIGVKRFIHCSSVGIYGEITNSPANEDTPCNPDLVYEDTKLKGERTVIDYYKDSGFPIVIIRPVWVYGPGCHRTGKLFKSIEKGRFLFIGNGETLRHCVYISDMLNAFELCAIKDEAIGEAFIIGDNKAISINELVINISYTIGGDLPNIRVPLSLMYPLCIFFEKVFKLLKKEPPFSRRSLKFFTNNTSFDISKAKKLLGYKPMVDLDEGLKRTNRWIKGEHKSVFDI
jgi:nucleoside-diphosphate-sugar epimerase